MNIKLKGFIYVVILVLLDNNGCCLLITTTVNMRSTIYKEIHLNLHIAFVACYHITAGDFDFLLDTI